jgi:uncharacterized protein YqfA (UPF0365 family)
MENLNFANFAVIIIVLLIIFLLLREVNLWYWKINKRIEIQEETNQLLKKILENNSESKVIKPEKIITTTEQTSVNDPAVLDELLKKLEKK